MTDQRQDGAENMIPYVVTKIGALGAGGGQREPGYSDMSPISYTVYAPDAATAKLRGAEMLGVPAHLVQAVHSEYMSAGWTAEELRAMADTSDEGQQASGQMAQWAKKDGR